MMNADARCAVDGTTSLRNEGSAVADASSVLWNDRDTRQDGTMSEQHETDRNDEPPETEADRRNANIALAIGFIVLVGSGLWLANAMLDARKADDCIASGRRNCVPLEVPAR
jgi:hypothetical protein